MSPNQRGGQNQGRKGKGGAGQGRGRQDNDKGRANASSDWCICPNCGHREPHQRGVPCTNNTCAKCGAILTR